MRQTRIDGRRHYGHLGGRLGAGLTALYLEKDWLEKIPETSAVYRMTASGRETFGNPALPPEYLMGAE